MPDPVITPLAAQFAAQLAAPLAASITLPRRLVVGPGSMTQCVGDLAALPGPLLLITSQAIGNLTEPIASLKHVHTVTIDDREPTFAMLHRACEEARPIRPKTVVGVGGGSVLDLAKVVAVLVDGSTSLQDILGIDRLTHRHVGLVCVPTTAGTGSEVSPNALLVDEQDKSKKAVISPHLVPDAAYVDAHLTLGCPPRVTAASGIDAMVHGIEAFANRLAHPLIDPIALEAVRLTGRSVVRATITGTDLSARSDMSLGSTLAGMCLGPVNTGAVHALAYPLGTMFGVAHGLSNAVLLTHVLRFNLPAAPQRYARIAEALGVAADGPDADTAARGLAHLEQIVRDCGIPSRLRDLGVGAAMIPEMARQAITIRRLLDRNVREVTLDDAIRIYQEAF
jgi:alcohol dehydrogenase